MNLAPRTIRHTRRSLVLLVLANLALPPAMWWLRQGPHDEIAHANPGAPGGTITGAVQVALIVAASYHLTFAALDVWLLRLLWLGRGQIAATVVQVFALLLSLVSWWAASSEFTVAILLLDVAALAVLVNVWTPSGRVFFRAGTPRLPSAR